MIPQVVVNKEVVDRTAILTAVYGGSPRQLYGTLKTLVLIKRTGNLDPIESGSQTTFNNLLGITPDSQFFTPEFNKSVQTSDNPDNEPNYKVVYPQVQTIPVSPTEGDIVQYMGADYGDFEQGKYYRYDGTDWKEFSIWYESPTYKITHTLPLIGQTGRIFNGTQYTGTMTKDVEDYSTVPQSPTEGLIIHYTGEDITDFYEGGYYLYTNSEWVQVYSKNQMVPTSYIYQIKMTNESGNESNVAEITVEAQCTNIADIVHSHEHYKDLYVEKLSAINANLGMISQGGMGNFEDMVNCWALSDISAEDSGVQGGVLRGTFKVGDDKEYFRVTPVRDPRYPNDPSKRTYKIELKAGNIELSTDVSGDTAMDFQNGTFVYNGDRTVRLKLSPEGITVQKYIGQTTPPDWSVVTNYQDVSKVITDPQGNMIISNSTDLPPLGFQVRNASIYHFDDEAEEDENGNNSQSITCDGDIIDITNKSPILLTDSSPNCFEGTIEKSIANYNGLCAFFTKSESVRVDRMLNIDGTQTDTADTYNSNMSKAKGSGTVGSYIGLSASQISNGIFNEIGE